MLRLLTQNCKTTTMTSAEGTEDLGDGDPCEIDFSLCILLHCINVLLQACIIFPNFLKNGVFKRGNAINT